MLRDKKLQQIVTKLFIRSRKLKIFLVFIIESYYVVPKNIKLNSKHYSIIKITNKWEFKQIEFNLSSDIDFKDFMNLYKICTAKSYSFLVNDTTLASDNPSGFRNSLLEII